MRLASREPLPPGQGPPRGGGERHDAENRPPAVALDGTLLRRWAVVAAAVLIGGLLGGLAGMLMPERYEASAFLVVSGDESAQAGFGTSATSFAQAFSRIARQPAVLAEVPEEAQVGAFGEDITLTAAPDAPVIEVVGTADNAELATLRANAVSRAIEEYVAARADATGYQATILTEAIVPGASQPAKTVPSVAAGMLVGLIVGVVLSLAAPGFARQRRRDRPDGRATDAGTW